MYGKDEENGEYNQQDLIQDLNVLIKHGMVDYMIDDEGEWVYKPSEKALRMTYEEQIAFILSLPETLEESE